MHAALHAKTMPYLSALLLLEGVHLLGNCLLFELLANCLKFINCNLIVVIIFHITITFCLLYIYPHAVILYN